MCGETRCLVRYFWGVFCVMCRWKPAQTCCLLPRFCYVANPKTRAGGLLRGSTMRVLKACYTCKTQEMPEEEEEEEEEEEKEEGGEESIPPPQTRVGKVCVGLHACKALLASAVADAQLLIAALPMQLCGHSQRMEDYLERLKQRI